MQENGDWIVDIYEFRQPVKDTLKTIDNKNNII